MPAQDKTGPLGEGPLTGRGLGPCTTGLARQRFGRGFGRGFRRNCGFGNFNYPIIQEPVVLTQNQEKEILEQDLTALKSEIQTIEQRLKELKK